MAGACCGTEGVSPYELGCLECGAACCPACAIHLESAAYCRDCAGSLLDTATVRASEPFDLN